ncbi:MAG: hypothetical protein KY455_01370 [Euryarchaeota archaeon]|nr:hypothetical protein [Euryarchaeota archaeon]
MPDPEHLAHRTAAARSGQHESGKVERSANVLWPGKVLYGAMMLYLVAAVGLLTAILEVTTGLGVGANAPAFLAFTMPWYVATFSVFTGLFAYMAVSQRSTGFAVLGAIFGILSFGFYGTNTLLSLVALGLIMMPRTRRARDAALTHQKAPDKPISSSLLMLTAGVVTLIWGIAIMFGLVGFEPYIQPAWLFGGLSALVGVIAIAAAGGLAQEKATDAAIGAGVLVILTFSLYVVGPALALGAIGLAFLERRGERHGVQTRG